MPDAPSSTSTLSPTQLDSVNEGLLSVRDSMHGPDDIGRAVVAHVLTVATQQGVVKDSGRTIEVPLTAVLHLPEDSATFDGHGSAKLCITAFGYEIICMEATVQSG